MFPLRNGDPKSTLEQKHDTYDQSCVFRRLNCKLWRKRVGGGRWAYGRVYMAKARGLERGREHVCERDQK